MTHAPSNSGCPFCLPVAGGVNEHVWSRESDVAYRDAQVMALIAATQ